MPLKITRASDPITVNRINMVIYGPPGIGKTSLAFTADSPLLLDFDAGSYRAANRKDVVRVAVMAMRVVLDGDHTLDQWRRDKGLDALTPDAAKPEGETQQAGTYEPCGGCGALTPGDRCIGCLHDFGAAKPEGGP